MAIDGERRVLHTRTVVDLEISKHLYSHFLSLLPYLDSVITSGRDDFSCVELQCSNGMVVFQRLENATRTQVPNLHDIQ